jgi:cyclic beta-1,2-glucan synthetase
MALARLGNGDEAVELFHMMNPINHTRTAADVDRYKAEPYVVAADIYAHPQHVGRGGWTWYTGSSSWMHRLAVGAILGVTWSGDTLGIAPCIPARWPKFTVHVRRGGSRYVIRVENPEHVQRGIVRAELDGAAVDPTAIPARDDGQAHEVRVIMGPAVKARRAASREEMVGGA